MKTEIPIEQLLRWRLARAEAEAPPAPDAARLLELSRPWWETCPDRFRALSQRLARIQIAHGNAMTDPRPGHSGHPVPALLVQAVQEIETAARILYLSVRDGQLGLRFQLDPVLDVLPARFQVTLVREADGQPLVEAPAAWSVDLESRLDIPLGVDLAREWETLRATDRMPFRLILLTEGSDG